MKRCGAWSVPGVICVLLSAVGASRGQPVFVLTPEDQTVCEGAQASFAVEVDFGGATTQVIEWEFDGGSGFVPLLDGDRGGRVHINTSVIASPATSTVTIDDTDRTADAGTYKCIASSGTGGAFASAMLSFFDAPGTSPAVVFEGDFIGLCDGASIDLESNPAGGDPANQLVIWSIDSGPDTSLLQFLPNAAVHDPTFMPTQSGSYVLRATTFDCIPQASGGGTVTVEVFDPLLADPSPAASTTCVLLATPLSANPSGGNGNYAFLWTVTPDDGSFFVPDAAAENPTFSPQIATDYQVSVTVSAADPGAVCAASPPAVVTVTAESTLIVAATTTEPEFCLGEATSLGADVTPPDGSLNYLWSIESGPDTDPAQLSSTTVAEPVFTPTTTTAADMPYELRVTVSGGACPPGSDTVTITVNEPPGLAPTATPDTVCAGHGAAMAANPSGSAPQGFVWSVVSGPDTSNGQFSPFPQDENPTFTPSVEGTYVLSVEVFDAFCDETASETVEVTAAPALSAAPTPAETTVCIDTEVSLSANPSGGGGVYTFLWSVVGSPPGGGADAFMPDATSENPTFTPTVAGTYELEVVVGADGCDDAVAAPVTIHATDVLTVSASSSDVEFCLPSSAVVSVDAGGGAIDTVWSVESGPDMQSDQFQDPTASTTLFTPSTFGDYTLRVDVVLGGGDCGGGSSDTVALTVHDEAVAEATAAADTICLGDETQLSVVSGGSGVGNQLIQWEIVAGPDTDASQLSDADTANPTFTPNASTSPGNDYAIEVTVFDPMCGGIPLVDDVLITVHDTLTAAPTADPPAGCEGVAVSLSANPSGGAETYTFAWSVEAGPSDPAQFDDTTLEEPTFTPSAGPVNYTLGLLLDDGQCEADAPVYFLSLPVKALLTVDATAEFDSGVLGEPMSLHANATGGVSPTFSWNVVALPADCASDDPIDDPALSDPVFTPGCLGTYTLSLVADDTVCDTATSGLDIDVILFNAEPSGDPASLCEGDSTVLSPNLNDGGAFGPFDYLWTIVQGPDTSPLQFDDPLAENPVFTPSSPGSYTIEVSADDQADTLPTVTGQVTIEVATDPPTLDASPQDATVCVGEAVTFTVGASGQDLSYQWKRDGVALAGETSATLAIQTVVFAHAGTYTCDVSNGCGTVTSQPAVLVVDPALGVTLFVGTREDGVLREAEITGCTISGDLIDRGDMGSGVLRVTGLAVQPGTGVLYAAVRRNPDTNIPETELATVDAAAGTATIIGTMGRPVADVAFHPDGTLYAVRGNHACPNCPEGGQPGEMYSVDVFDASLTPLTPAIVLGDDEGHSIAFDEAGRLYHHALKPGVHSRLTRRNLAAPDNVEILKEFATDVSLTAMTIRSDLFLAARRGSPSELWSLDHAGGTYDKTVLGPLTASGVGNRTVLGLAFVCAVAGDADCDGDVDLSDYAVFVSCAADASASGCMVFDGDGDGDVDLADWGRFQVAFTGSAGP